MLCFLEKRDGCFRGRDKVRVVIVMASIVMQKKTPTLGAEAKICNLALNPRRLQSARMHSCC